MRIHAITTGALLGLLLTAGSVIAQNNASDGAWIEATLSVKSPRIYVHSQFTLTLTVASRNMELGQNFNISSLPPDSSLHFSNFRDLPVERRKVNGVTTEVRRFRIDVDALKAGRTRLAPRLRFQILTRQRGGFFGSFTQVNQRELQVRSITIDVLPIPAAGRPKNFSGAIGAFNIERTVTPTEVEVEALVDVVLKITGKGYIEDVTWPELSPGRHFKLYPRKIDGDLKRGVTIQQTIIPQTTNATHIPALTFSYFDTATGRYREARQAPVELSFHSATSAAATVRYTPRNKTPAGTESPKSVSGTTPLTQGARDAASLRAARFRTAGVVMTGIACLCGVVAVVYFWMFLRQRRKTDALALRHRRAAALTMTAALLLSAASAAFHTTATSGGTTRLISENVSAYLGPSTRGLILFETPQNAQVEVVETASPWVRIRYLDQSGWILEDALSRAEDPE